MTHFALPADLATLPANLDMHLVAALVGDHYDTFRKRSRRTHWTALGLPDPLNDGGHRIWDRDAVLAWRAKRSRGLGGAMQDAPSAANDPLGERLRHPLDRPAFVRAVSHQRARIAGLMKGANP